MRTSFLSRFTPSLMSAQDLEAIFVQRETLAQRLINLIRESAFTPAKHHALLIGPRGIGKSHLVALIYHRLKAMEDLRDRLLIAWLREEEWGISSFLDLLLRIFRALDAECGDAALRERVKALYSRGGARQSEDAAAALLKEFVGDRALLVVAENLDDIFAGLADEGQKRLRAYLQQNPFCAILATAQSLFNGASLRTSPFYGCFRIQHLQELSFDEAVSLLSRVAQHGGDPDLASFIQTPAGRARIRAIQHLAGGNHRVYIILSQFLTRQSLDRLVDPFLQMLDDLTPYYQARIGWLSPQQRKIVEFLCDRGSAVPVKAIARQCFITPQTTSSQLKDLREKGYVRSNSWGREAYYELREPLMRLCTDVKRNRGEPLRLIVDFLRLWFTPQELQKQMVLVSPDLPTERLYLQMALATGVEDQQDPRVAACWRDYSEYVRDGNFASALPVADELVTIRGDAADWFERGRCLEQLGRHSEAVDTLDRALRKEPGSAFGWGLRGWALRSLDRNVEALECFDRAVRIDPEESAHWSSRGSILFRLGRYEEAVQSFDQAITRTPVSAIVWGARACALAELQRWSEALESSDEAIELAPLLEAAWATRALALACLGRPEEALSSCRKAIDLEENLSMAWSVQGMALTMLGRWDAALVSYDRALEINAEDAHAWGNRAVALANMGQDEEALASCQQAIDLGETSAHAFFNLAEFLLALNRWEEGIVALDDALRRFAHSERPCTGDTGAIICNLLNNTPAAPVLADRISRLVEVFAARGVLSALGAGLGRCIPAVLDGALGERAVQQWQQAWQAVASGRPEFELPLRLLAAAVRYRETRDPRVLLELAIEERRILEPLLGLPDVCKE